MRIIYYSKRWMVMLNLLRVWRAYKVNLFGPANTLNVALGSMPKLSRFWQPPKSAHKHRKKSCTNEPWFMMAVIFKFNVLLIGTAISIAIGIARKDIKIRAP